MAEYKHFRGGDPYTVLTDTALIEATKERAVVYEKDGQTWVRPYADFHALVEVDNPDGTSTFTPRFSECSEYPHNT